MPLDVMLTAGMAEGRIAELNRLREQMDWALDNPMGQPQPIGQTGLLERLGGLLWEASGLDPGQLRGQLEAAKDGERALRLLITDADQLHWPWELLYHEHPELGFLWGSTLGA